jgi:hypothetical protein
MKSDKRQTLGHFYTVECRDAYGNLKYREEFQNLVPLVGRNHYLDATLKSGNGSSVNAYAGIKGVGTILDSDKASNHPNWNFITSYDNNGFGMAAFLEFSAPSFGEIFLTEPGYVTFVLNDRVTVAGVVIWVGGDINKNPTNDTTAIFMGIADFSSPINTNELDQILITLSCSITPDFVN